MHSLLSGCTGRSRRRGANGLHEASRAWQENRPVHPAGQPPVSEDAPISSRESGADLRLRREARPLSCLPRRVTTCSSHCGPASPSAQNMSSCGTRSKVTCQDSGNRVVALRRTRSPDSKAIERPSISTLVSSSTIAYSPCRQGDTEAPASSDRESLTRDRPRSRGLTSCSGNRPTSCGVPHCEARRPGTSKGSLRPRSHPRDRSGAPTAAWQGSCRLGPLPDPLGGRSDRAGPERFGPSLAGSSLPSVLLAKSLSESSTTRRITMERTSMSPDWQHLLALPRPWLWRADAGRFPPRPPWW
jgi:hypothetical protein